MTTVNMPSNNGICDKGTCRNGTTEIRIKMAHLNISGYIYVVSTKIFNLVIKIFKNWQKIFIFSLIHLVNWPNGLIVLQLNWIVVT